VYSCICLCAYIYIYIHIYIYVYVYTCIYRSPNTQQQEHEHHHTNNIWDIIAKSVQFDKFNVLIFPTEHIVHFPSVLTDLKQPALLLFEGTKVIDDVYIYRKICANICLYSYVCIYMYI
jgi:hypothetical protein